MRPTAIKAAHMEIYALWIALVAMAFAAVLPHVPVGAWVVRLFDFPRLQLACLALLGAVYVAARGRYVARWDEAWLLAAGFLALAVWQASRVAVFTPAWSPEVQAAEGAAKGLRVGVANVEFKNTEREAFVDLVRSEQFDLVLVIEANEAWAEAMDSLKNDYPHRAGVDLPEGCGILLYSRTPLEGTELRYLVTDDRPSIWTTIEDADGARTRVVGLHPVPPGLYDEDLEGRHDSRIRDAELMMVADEVAKDPDANWLVMGDFNDVAWSHTTRLFKRLSGLKDPRVGRGFYNTYHAQHWALRFPIDHVFVSPSARLHSLERLRIEGSDHFGIAAKVAFPAATPVQPEAEGDDREDAEELIDEGLQDAEEAAKLERSSDTENA